MRILYITAFYPPNNIIASVRPSALCKYFARSHEVHVLTYATDSRCKTYDPTYYGPSDVDVCYLPEYASRLFVELNAPREFSPVWRSNVLLAFVKRFWNFLRMLRLLLVSSLSVSRKTREVGPDVIIASYGPHYVLWSGLIAKVFAPGSKLVIDIRDPISGNSCTESFNIFDAMLQALYVRFADGIVGVTPWIVKGIRSGGIPTRVITNGYDGDWIATDVDTSRLVVDDSKLNILVMGTIYEMRNPAALISELRRAIESGGLREEEVVLHYAGGDYPKLKTYLEEEGLLGIARDHGYLGKDEVLSLERKSDVLVLLTWNTANDQDVYTGKLFEYFMVGKPILALVEGDVPHSGVRTIIERANAGVCFEYCCDSPEVIYRFLLGAKASSRPADGPKQGVEEFSYQNLAREYIEFVAGL